MSKKRLLLVNPVNWRRAGLTMNRSTRFPPIAFGMLAAVTPDHWDVALADENWERFSYREADLVGITAFTASANRAYEIASAYRERGVPVVMGGIHASMRPDEALRFVDSVVVGEADAVWPEVVADVEAGRLRSIYQGTSADLAGMPRPRRDFFHRGYMFASVQTSRGCPMDCDFCSVTPFNGFRYRRRPPEEVLDELAGIPQKMFFFVDDNIIGYNRESRDQALAIFRGMVDRKLGKWWLCQASINFADDEEVLHWAAKSGCKLVFLGIEANDADVLEHVNKRLNVARGVDSYDDAFRRIHRAGISVLGSFIFGVDGDTPEKIRGRARYMIRCGVDVMQGTLLTPLPGTRLFARLEQEGRLLYTDFPKDWDRYDMSEVVFRPSDMEPSELTRVVRECTRQMYTMPVSWWKLVRALVWTRNLPAAAFAWQSNSNYRTVARVTTGAHRDAAGESAR
jgi:radical SAM superfamily enzyme YgiQ (UPF0313 family)